MSESDKADLEADLSKKQRLINAWVAVGPEAKTTDVSELTDTSSGYASDLRRALEGEADQEIDESELREAYTPELVEIYRTELGADAVDGQWEFEADLVEPTEEEPAETAEPSADPSSTGPPGEPATGEQPSAPTGGQPQPGPEHQGGSAQQPAPQGQPSQRGRATRQQPVQPQPGSQRPPAGAPAGGQQPASSTQPAQGGQPPTGQASAEPQQQPRQPTGQVCQQQPSGAQQAIQRGLTDTTSEQVFNRLQQLDASLAASQQSASSEVYGLPAGSRERSIAVSKYNLIVQVRESISELASLLPTAPQRR